MKRSVFSATARRFTLVGAVIVVGAGYFALQEAALLSPCANELRAELVSPDARYIAAHYVRDCGPRKNFSTQVSIRPSERNFDYGRDVRLFIASGICEVDVEWTKHVLHIHHSTACLVMEKTFSWRSVKVFVDET